jgi:nitric oxide dioxygenase
VVQATLPPVADNIAEIARRFYRHMFEARPDLLDGLFNRGNQAAGTQQVALAGSVAAFASALVKTPEQLPEQLLNRIAHKHASLGLRPDQYRVVHEHLFRAIADVLGAAVTPAAARHPSRTWRGRRPRTTAPASRRPAADRPTSGSGVSRAARRPGA